MKLVNGEPHWTEIYSAWHQWPGDFFVNEGDMLQRVVSKAPSNAAHVELGGWCGRSLACAAEALPKGVQLWSVDNHLPDAQAVVLNERGLSAADAKTLWMLIASLYVGRGIEVMTLSSESSAAGREYTGRPVHSLFVDDHHSAEQVEKNVLAWAPRMAESSWMMFHDYLAPGWGVSTIVERMLPKFGFLWVEQAGSLGVWRRG